MKIDPYYQRQKCSPWIVVSSKVSFTRIFAGVRWRARVGWSKMAIFASFSRYIFRTFTSKATFIISCYVAPYWLNWLFNDIKIDDLEWPFCVKICFGLGN